MRIQYLVAVTVAVACSPMPRAMDPAPDYGVKLVDVSPRLGSQLVAGSFAHFTITVAYHLEATDSGRIVLVIQDDRGTSLVPRGAQTGVGVARGSGRATVRDSVLVPTGIRELQLFVLLAPKDYQSVHGQIPLQFPVR